MSEIQNQEADLLTKFKNDEVSIDNMSDTDIEELAKQLHDLDETVAVVPEAREVEENDQKSDMAQQSEKDNRETKEKKSLREKYEDKANDANRYYQLYTSELERRRKLEERIDSLEKKISSKPTESEAIKPQTKTETTTDDIDDPFDEIVRLRKEQQEMKNALNEWKQKQEEDRAFSEKKQQIETELMQIEELQREYPNLKTSKSFREIDSEYSSWYASLGKESVGRYFSDNEFRNKLDKEGRGVPKDFDKYETLVKAYNRYKDGRYPTVRAAFRDSDDFDKLSLQKSSPSYYDATEKVIEKMASQNNEPPVMGNTESKEHFEGDGLTIEFMTNWLDKNPHPEKYSAKQQEIYDRIEQRMKDLGYSF